MENATPSSAEIKVWSQKHIGEVLDVPKEKVDPKAEFDRLGLDSTSLMSYLMTLEEWLHIELVPDIFFTYTTIEGLSEHLASRLSVHQGDLS
ncbi:MAG: hypothetical protein CBCREVIR_3679 [Candidatus Burkholderia crenata]|nr:acyl carrier protein [Candidatus Burkholderia crenata]CAH2813486.1 MAG: hypothetical protein CBCREVIR_3679 [Candidatus Burkholderia crenata]